MNGHLTEISYEEYIKDCNHDTSNMLFDVFDFRLDNKCRRCRAELPEAETGMEHTVDRWRM